MTWWLVIPVIIYSLGVFALWLVLVRKHRESELLPEWSIRVSVVIAARNEEKNIARLLKSLLLQDYPHELIEVVVINDGSTDRTPIVVSEFIADARLRSQADFRLINNPFPGKKGAIRYGVEKSSGDLILTTDADCEVGPRWIGAHAGYYAASGADMILGEVYQKPSGGFASHFGVLEFSALQGITEASALAGYPVMCNGANMAYTREAYIRHSSNVRHEIASGDDMFLMHSLKRAGGRIGYAGCEAAAVVTASAGTAAALLRQRARWASKAYYFSDAATLTLAAATAACNAAVTAAAAMSLFSLKHLSLLALLYGIRLVPDLLITRHNIKKREERFPLPLFLLAELLYPFYFIAVAVLSLFPSARGFGKK